MSDFQSFAVRSAILIDLGLVTPKASRYDKAGEAPRHRARVLIPKIDTAALTAVKAAQDAALAAKNLLGKPGVRLLLQDGDEVDGKGVRIHPDFYAGFAFFTASAKPERAPTLQVGREKRAGAAADFYSGCQIAGAFTCFAYDMGAQSKGASALMNLVWKIGPGQRINTGGDASDQLSDLQVGWSADAQDRQDLVDQVTPADGDDTLSGFFK